GFRAYREQEEIKELLRGTDSVTASPQVKAAAEAALRENPQINRLDLICAQISADLALKQASAVGSFPRLGAGGRGPVLGVFSPRPLTRVWCTPGCREHPYDLFLRQTL
ncbi:MAG TPA: hypothetical protein VEH47_09265, partial [Candidatus Acidoferrales bacterium]|nr:hypothetical protein [Candidatus Acidoferrales bacterium]